MTWKKLETEVQVSKEVDLTVASICLLQRQRLFQSSTHQQQIEQKKWMRAAHQSTLPRDCRRLECSVKSKVQPEIKEDKGEGENWRMSSVRQNSSCEASKDTAVLPRCLGTGSAGEGGQFPHSQCDFRSDAAAREEVRM